MGHIAAKQAYQKLQTKLKRWPIGTPGQTTIFEILETVYKPEDAQLAARLPLRFTHLSGIAQRLKMPEAELKPRLEALADKGLVLDFMLGGKMHYMLTPIIVGFMEFSMMRTRDDIDQKKLAGLIHRYLLEERDFADQFKPGTISSVFRTLVHETVLPENYSEVLDWEKASYLVENAGRWAVGLCHCRHVSHHLGKDCQKLRLESCLTLGPGADYVVRHGLAREMVKSEARALLEETREKGLVHIADNVRRNPSFICNCCSCCCEVLGGFRKFRTFGAFSSNYEAQITPDACTGCKKCMRACPVEAIRVIERPHKVGNRNFKYLAEIDREVCIGCGVCVAQCKFDSMKMVGRPQRRIAPENAFARTLHMAIEQGKLGGLLADADDGMTAHAASALLGAVLKLPPAKQLLAREAFRSRFVNFMLDGARKGRMASSQL